MRALLRLPLIFMAILPFLGWQTIASDDIPGNCEYRHAVFYRPELIPRFSPHNQRLVLVDWNTGAEQLSYPGTLNGTEFRLTNWSPECQYLVGATGILDDTNTMIWTTFVWDTINNTQIAQFEDARVISHPFSWDTNSAYAVVETRRGAILWSVSSDSRLQLTMTSDGNGRSFRAGSISWNYETQQVSGLLSISPFGTAIYSLQTGELLAISNRFGESLETNSTQATLAQQQDSDYPCIHSSFSRYSPAGLRIVYQEYNQRIVLTDVNERSVVAVLEDNIDLWHFGVIRWSPACRYAYTTLNDGAQSQFIIWDMQTYTRAGTLNERGVVYHWSWAPDNTYLLLSTRNAAYLWHIATNQQTRLNPDVNVVRYGSGDVYAYLSPQWDVESGQLRIRHSGYEVTYDLATGAPLNYMTPSGENFSPDSPIVQQLVERLASPYGCSPRIVYQIYNERLVLEDWATRALIHIIEDNLVLTEFRSPNLSPNCRFVSAIIRMGTGEYATVVWDLALDQRVEQIQHALDAQPRQYWSPDGNVFLVETLDGAVLWNLLTNEQHQLVDSANASGNSFVTIQWDIASGQLLTVNVDDNTAVNVYDIWTGEHFARYTVDTGSGAVNFFFSSDREWVVVYTNERTRDHNGLQSGIAIWNRYTNTSVQLIANDNLRPVSGRTRLSSDNRYLYIVGNTRTDIWDLQQITVEPTYEIYVQNPTSLEFVDEFIVETHIDTYTRELSARRLYLETTYRYDIRTGELIDSREETELQRFRSFFSYWYGDEFGR